MPWNAMHPPRVLVKLCPCDVFTKIHLGTSSVFKSTCDKSTSTVPAKFQPRHPWKQHRFNDSQSTFDSLYNIMIGLDEIITPTLPNLYSHILEKGRSVVLSGNSWIFSLTSFGFKPQSARAPNAADPSTATWATRWRQIHAPHTSVPRDRIPGRCNERAWGNRQRLCRGKWDHSRFVKDIVNYTNPTTKPFNLYPTITPSFVGGQSGLAFFSAFCGNFFPVRFLLCSSIDPCIFLAQRQWDTNFSNDLHGLQRIWGQQQQILRPGSL